MVALIRFANPIEWQETNHQRYSIPLVMRRWWLLAPLSLALVVTVVALTLQDITSPTRDLAIYIIWIVQAITAARAISAGANAVSREHTGKTWDSLVLTGVSARRILWGKWLGVMHRIAPWMLALGTVRLVMLPILMLSLVNRYAWYTGYRYYSTGSSYYGVDYLPDVSWVAWAAILAVVMVVVLTLLEVMCCTALGLAASAVTRRGWLAMVGALTVRCIPVILFAVFTRYEVGYAPSWRVLRFPALSLADSGSSSIYQLVLPLNSWTNGTHINAVGPLMVTALFLFVMFAASLIVAWAAIRRAGALPHLDSAALKSRAVIEIPTARQD
jgi:ABC-type transport system involved in multi-copper enzyme maturation permease subunit